MDEFIALLGAFVLSSNNGSLSDLIRDKKERVKYCVMH